MRIIHGRALYTGKYGICLTFTLFDTCVSLSIFLNPGSIGQDASEQHSFLYSLGDILYVPLTGQHERYEQGFKIRA